MKDKRPKIPQFVIPSTQELITDRWDKEPGARPSFEDVVGRLVEMKFKVIHLSCVGFVNQISAIIESLQNLLHSIKSSERWKVALDSHCRGRFRHKSSADRRELD
jgi:hypothetical protein